MRTLLAPLVLLLALAACRDRFSPDVYATRAVQQADKVEQGIIVGVRQVRVSAEGSTGAATGAAAGGVLGAQAPGGGIVSALGGVGGALVGGLIGKGAEHVAVDTNAFEYIVRTSGNTLMRVTQQDREPLRRGQQVLLIMGSQARVVPDYTVGAEGAAAGAHAHSAPGSGQPPAAQPSQGPAEPAAAPPLPGQPGLPAAMATPLVRALAPEGSPAAAAAALLPAHPGYPPIPPAPPPPRAVDTPPAGG
jgi:outer membrane lipoprotein SlyB